MPAPTLSSFRRQTISNVFVGIDFGTSYTKVSYSYAPTQVPQIETIKWDNDFFKQTVLYVQNERLFFEKPEGDFKEVKYFKYSTFCNNYRQIILRQAFLCTYHQFVAIYSL